MGRWLGLVAAVTTSVALLAAPQNPPATPPPPVESPQPPAPPTPPAVTPPDAITLVGAGDIANCNIAGGSGAVATARLLDQIPGTIFTVGDHAYPSGTADQFRDCYEPALGQASSTRTRPSPGNHDYLTSNGKAYFDYFGEAAGPKGKRLLQLRSRQVAHRLAEQHDSAPTTSRSSWSGCGRTWSSTTPRARWPTGTSRSSAPGPHGADITRRGHMLDVWNALYQFGADVVVNGHDHDYERFAPQNPGGKPDPKGIREFVVGTGGGGLYQFKSIRAEQRGARQQGVRRDQVRRCASPTTRGSSCRPWGSSTISGTGACAPWPDRMIAGLDRI